MFEYSAFEAVALDQYALEAMDEKDIIQLANQEGYEENESLDDDEIYMDDLSWIKRMVERDGVDPHIPNEWGWTILHSCCHGGRLDGIQYLVEERKVDVERVEDEAQKNTALHCACQGGNLPTVRYLVEHAVANVDARNYKEWTPLHLACFEGHLDIVKYLIENRKVNPRAKAINEVTPLHAASYWARYDIIRYLLPYSIVDEKALNLIWDTETCWQTKERLLENFVRNHMPDKVNDFKRYPLHTVLQCPLPSNDAFLDCLHHYGTDRLKMMDVQGRLPLHVALNTATSTSVSNISPFLTRQLIEFEPRAATVKDSSTGLYPHERVATLAAENNVAVDWFNVMYTLIRTNDPAILRGVPTGEDTCSRIIKEEETTNDEPCIAKSRRKPTHRSKNFLTSWIRFRQRKERSKVRKQ